jgi:hypothetical protein
LTHWHNSVFGNRKSGYVFSAEKLNTYYVNRSVLLERVVSDETKRVPLASATLRAVRATLPVSNGWLGRKWANTTVW